MAIDVVRVVCVACLALYWPTNAHAASKGKRRPKAPSQRSVAAPQSNEGAVEAESEAAAKGVDDTDALVIQKARKNRKRVRPRDNDEDQKQRRAAGSVYIALSAGTGTGWHPDRMLEGNSDLQTSGGYSNTGLVLNPELGWQITRGFALALAGRQQLLAPGQWQQTEDSPAPKMANAAFLKAIWSIGRGNAVLQISAMAGGGDGFRLIVPRRPSDGLSADDSVRGGPYIFGPGLGFEYHIASSFSWFVQGRVLAGAPIFAVVAEGSSGFALAL